MVICVSAASFKIGLLMHWACFHFLLQTIVSQNRLVYYIITFRRQQIKTIVHILPGLVEVMACIVIHKQWPALHYHQQECTTNRTEKVIYFLCIITGRTKNNTITCLFSQYNTVACPSSPCTKVFHFK